MYKCTFKFLLIFLVILSVDCQKWNNGRPAVPKRRNGSPADEVKPVDAPSRISGAVVRRGGIGAWGYVAITLFVILSGLGIYYTIILYPIVCKKQRMYHVMGSTTV